MTGTGVLQQAQKGNRMKLFGSDVGVDLGTATLRMSLKGRGVVLRVPTILAV